MTADAMVAARLRAAGCVFAEEEAAFLTAAAGSRAELDALVARRITGEPLEQVVGWASFSGLRIGVDPWVFVPRRRSEFLVSVAVGLASRPAAAGVTGTVPGPVIVDLCCGTGALGLAVLHGLMAPAGHAADRGGPDGSPVASLRSGAPELHAADLDPAAVACARRNIGPVGGRAYQGDLFGALPAALLGRATILICNAPYVPTGQVAFLPAEARDHEPRLALDGGTDGLGILRRVAAEAPDWLAPGGVLLVETSSAQAPAMTAAMSAAGLTPATHSDEEFDATVTTGTLLVIPNGRSVSWECS